VLVEGGQALDKLQVSPGSGALIYQVFGAIRRQAGEVAAAVEGLKKDIPPSPLPRGTDGGEKDIPPAALPRGTDGGMAP
jgi:hypothetical protein